MFRITGLLGVTSVALVLLLSAVGASGQDKEAQPKLRGQLPPGWKKIGLTEIQTQKVYSIRGEYQAKISKLQAELKKLRAEERRELFSVLTDDQKAALRRLAEERSSVPAKEAEPKKQ